jgi:hypothetical protein
MVVAEPPTWPKGWPATPCGWIGHLHVSRVFFSPLNGGGLATPLGHWGGSATTKPVWWWPSHPYSLRGWFNHPSFFTFFFFFNRGGPATPCGWIGHPSSFMFFFFFFPLTGGGPATPLGHWGGSTTTRPTSLVVAEPPQWPKGWPASHPLWVDRPPTLPLSLFF